MGPPLRGDVALWAALSLAFAARGGDAFRAGPVHPLGLRLGRVYAITCQLRGGYGVGTGLPCGLASSVLMTTSRSLFLFFFG